MRYLAVATNDGDEWMRCVTRGRLAVESAGMDFRTAETNGQRFVFADSGDGPPVVLFHGSPATPSGWEPAARVHNEAGHRTIVPFLRGYHPETIVPGRGYGSRARSREGTRR